MRDKTTGVNLDEIIKTVQFRYYDMKVMRKVLCILKQRKTKEKLLKYDEGIALITSIIEGKDSI